jgi:predicted DNA-binding transcriptional regulator AlpA
MSQQVLLNPKQVAERLGLSVKTLSDWRYKRIGPPVTKIGKFPKYAENLLEQWIEQQTVFAIE